MTSPLERRITATEDREAQVRRVHGNMNPQQVKGLRVTGAERHLLLERLDQLRVEIDNAPIYEGALA